MVEISSQVTEKPTKLFYLFVSLSNLTFVSCKFHDFTAAIMFFINGIQDSLYLINCNFSSIIVSNYMIDITNANLRFINSSIENCFSQNNYLFHSFMNFSLFESVYSKNTSTGFLFSQFSNLTIKNSSFSKNNGFVNDQLNFLYFPMTQISLSVEINYTEFKEIFNSLNGSVHIFLLFKTHKFLRFCMLVTQTHQSSKFAIQFFPPPTQQDMGVFYISMMQEPYQLKDLFFIKIWPLEEELCFLLLFIVTIYVLF